ncbi:MAG: Heme O synthase, protoheme IX farnesyltransferase COX10-CtaB [uncultured Rubellimicrobium sp.]|uniref:Protoheme IX farnesyltransferase n=1 Tax=uncultured Rubellimicrobium sp. TaxID=543078 RepID=A0A6J4QH24_9RHOB|nr:MAG: Heme O synthase, protoheme IX farnesyltransferase COX10-CtaB [uncultured Rubellimicrobium sp.]
MSDATLEAPLAGPAEAEMGDFWALLKPRVMSLVVFTAMVGLVAAPGHVHPFIAFVSILCIAVGGGASGALNMWWDADIDAVMRRTRNRPVPSGRVQPGDALAIGLALSGFSVMLLGLAANWMAAGLLAFTIFFYAVVYTMWLKRRTPQNIVIGGLAGALPPLVGWVAATGSFAWAPVLMVALVFMWTPPHFWALALFVRGDYGLAKVPMLTETHGDRTTRRHILAYAVLLVPVSLALGLTPVAGVVYLSASVVLNLLFVRSAWIVWRRDHATSEADRWGAEKGLFKLSLLYLFLHFGALLAEAALGTWGA